MLQSLWIHFHMADSLNFLIVGLTAIMKLRFIIPMHLSQLCNIKKKLHSFACFTYMNGLSPVFFFIFLNISFQNYACESHSYYSIQLWFIYLHYQMVFLCVQAYTYIPASRLVPIFTTEINGAIKAPIHLLTFCVYVSLEPVSGIGQTTECICLQL